MSDLGSPNRGNEAETRGMDLEPDTIVQVLLRERLRVTALAAAVVRDVHAADDIFQQVVLAALEVAARFRDTDHVLAWSFRAAASSPRSGPQQAVAVAAGRGARSARIARWVDASLAAETDRGEALHRCMGRLGSPARELLQMKYVEGLSAATIADRQRRTAGAVYQNLCRIHRMLRECVERRHGGARSRELARGVIVTPSDPSELQLYDLFVRYWDNSLTPAEQDELNAHLAANAEAREWFHLFTFQAVAAADRPVLEPASDSPASRDFTPQPLPRVAAVPATSAAGTVVSRRRMMQFVGGGLAAGLGGAGVGWWLWPASDGPPCAMCREPWSSRIPAARPSRPMVPSRPAGPSRPMGLDRRS